MDKYLKTLVTVLKVLLAENQLVGWNVAPKKRGMVFVQIKINMEDEIFDEQNLDLDSLCQNIRHTGKLQKIKLREIICVQKIINRNHVKDYDRNPLKSKDLRIFILVQQSHLWISLYLFLRQ
ncbi:MAG: hypothetical protein VX100_14790 [Pseudomonadota bacterium]|nr:hypothetical protein [Pseudomonadota bacterium]